MTIKSSGNTIIDTDRNVYFDYLTFRNVTAQTGTQAQGYNYGYASGGYDNPISNKNQIERFPFALNSSVTDVGNLTVARMRVCGQSSDSYGYTTGGSVIGPPGAGTLQNIIDRFPFASATGNAADVGDTLAVKAYSSGQSSTDYGYSSGGENAETPTRVNVIERFPFSASTTNTTDVGNLSSTRKSLAGHSSETHGYMSGGDSIPGYSNVIDRFPFASASTDATDVGDLTVSRGFTVGLSSQTHGYCSVGYSFPPVNNYNTIDRWPFASTTTNATDVGDHTGGFWLAAGISSTEHGYTAGGSTFVLPNVYEYYTGIDRYPFAASTTGSTDVSDLITARGQSTGQQY